MLLYAIRATYVFSIITILRIPQADAYRKSKISILEIFTFLMSLLGHPQKFMHFVH